MPHGLDHIVHAVRDLDAGGGILCARRLPVGARNRHAWGTHNRIVQFFLKAFAGVDDLHSSSIGVRACTENGDIEIMPPHAAHGATLIFETAKEG
jgi:hypothetical protein